MIQDLRGFPDRDIRASPDIRPARELIELVERVKRRKNYMFKNNTASESNEHAEGNGEAIATMVSNVVDTISDGNVKIKEQLNSAIDQARKARSSVNEYAKVNPWQVAGVAAAVGFLAGWLLKKRG